MNKEVSFVMAPENHYYSGTVMRRVTANLDNGMKIVVSETTTGMELDEFQDKYPNEPVDGQRGSTLRDELSYMTDDQLEAMGLKRVGSARREDRPKREEEILESAYTYPVLEGYGWYRLSHNGPKVKGKAEAIRRQKLIDDGTPDPLDQEIMDKQAEEAAEE